MSDDYTPTTKDIRDAWWSEQCAKPDLDFDDIYNAAFDRWLAAHDAEVRAAVLAEQGEPEWEYTWAGSADDGDWVLDLAFAEVAEAEEFAGKNVWIRNSRGTLHHRREAGPWLPVEENGESNG